MHIVRIGSGETKLHSAESVGAKAANLARMASLGVPVPPAFVLPVSLCAAIADGDSHARHKLADGLKEGIEFLEHATGKSFGDRRSPLLVSVRSGAARSMPGMLETVLDVGCNLTAVHGLIRMTGHPHFAWDCRRRFLESFGSVVLGIAPALFAKSSAELVSGETVTSLAVLDSEAIERLASAHQQTIEDQDLSIPEDPMEQLEAAAQAVYRSWTSKRACTYRELQHLEHLKGTAVTVQAMVFGNRGLSSGAGVAFSRDPSTGAVRPIIDVLFESQGEDVVSGSHTPEDESGIVRAVPGVAPELRDTLARLEREFGDVQDVEFTIEEGKLWILQTRAAKRTPLAALRFAVDFVHEGMLTPSQALQRLKGLDVDALAHQRLVDPSAPAACGIGASTGIAVGRAAFNSTSAERMAAAGDPVILVRPDTSTADVAGFAAAAGIVTAVGGRTAHAALVARQMAKPCVVGCKALMIDATETHARLGDHAIQMGDWLSINGETGDIHLGRCEVAVERPNAELAELEHWRASLHK